MKIKVHHYIKDQCTGNILWSPAHPMRNGKFPASHPIGGVSRPGEAELGSDGKLEKFRSLGYWASCFPEGDGITFVPEKEQSNEQVDQDIKDSFGWEIRP